MPSDLSKVRIFSKEECMRLPHVVLPLRGKFKGEVGFDTHVVNVAHETQSGLRPRWWADKLAEVARSEGRTNGPAFATPSGHRAHSGNCDTTFRDALSRVKASTSYFEKLDVDTQFGISRPPHKTAPTRAARAGLGDSLDEMNRGKFTDSVCRR